MEVAQNSAHGQRARVMDALTALRLQIEWGADEALEAAPVNRLRPPPTRVPPASSAPSASSVSSSHTSSTFTTKAIGTKDAGRVTPAERAARAAAAVTTLEELRAAIAGFDGSALRDTAANLVFLEGSPTSGLLLVNEAPNADADRAGDPFAGPVGAYLEHMLRSVGLDRGAICVAPLIPWRPPGDRPPSQVEIATCLPFLHRLIAIVAPRRIVALGPLPARALLGATPMRRRSSPVWQEATISGCAASIPTLAIPSPGVLLRLPTQRRSAWADLRLLRHSLDTDLTQK
jgi:uracil-DNA glycosylase family 4